MHKSPTTAANAQQQEILGRRVPCGDSDSTATSHLPGITGGSRCLHQPNFHVLCLEPPVLTSCTTQISHPPDHTQHRAVGWKGCGMKSSCNAGGVWKCHFLRHNLFSNAKGPEVQESLAEGLTMGYMLCSQPGDECLN